MKKPTPRSKEGKGEDKSSSKSRLEELVELVESTAQAKGWTAYLKAHDSKNFRYATVEVSRKDSSHNEITGTFEILCDERIRITYHKTSFFDYGLPDLYDAVGNEFLKLPWIKKNSPDAVENESEIALIERVLRRFHLVAKQLRHRHDDRPSLEVKDEYDTQDLLYAILRAFLMISDLKSIHRAMRVAHLGSTFS